jgi:diacylglycerol kinase family enzyme
LTYFAVINPAAGGGRCGKLAPAALDKLRAAGIAIEAAATAGVGHGIELARAAYKHGHRRFLAVGGDGTAYEIVNGVFPAALNAPEPPLVAFLPLGTGNSFLRDFTKHGVAYATQAILEQRERRCDVLKLTHDGGELYYINLLSMGFSADVAAVTNRRFKPLGHLGYLLGVITGLARLDRRPFPLRVDDEPEFDRRRCLFLSFSNSKFTGGTMMIAPHADPCDGRIEYVRWGPIGRLGLIANLHTLYSGTHIRHPMASRRAVQKVEFELDTPADIMIDGEVLTVRCLRIEVLPAALRVAV